MLDSVYLHEGMHDYIHCSTDYYIKNARLIKSPNIKSKTDKAKGREKGKWQYNKCWGF